LHFGSKILGNRCRNFLVIARVRRQWGRKSGAGDRSGQLGDDTIVGGREGTVVGADSIEGASSGTIDWGGWTSLSRWPEWLSASGAAPLGIVAANLAIS
jgi:hypothetical protein